MRFDLKHGAWLELLEDWLGPHQAADLGGQIEAELDWRQRTIKLFGRDVLQPRLISWCGDLPYRYSGETLAPRGWSSECEQLRRLVSRQLGTSFNHVLANLYRTGSDSMGFHADDEPELDANPIIASVSFGAARRFVVKARRDGQEPRLELQLRQGSLLVMGGTLQHHYLHGIPKQRTVPGPRLNLTFRLLHRAPRIPVKTQSGNQA